MWEMFVALTLFMTTILPLIFIKIIILGDANANELSQDKIPIRTLSKVCINPTPISNKKS